jgi:plastocyanin
MNRNQRIALVVAAVLVAVIAFVIVSPGGDDDDSEQAAQTTTTGGTATAPSTDETATPDTPAEPAVTRIAIRGGEVVGGPKTITVTKGDQVRIVVSADAHDDMHLHGYDIEKPVEPGKPASFDFEANLEGQFEMESHVAEDAGRDPKVANLVVEPS